MADEVSGSSDAKPDAESTLVELIGRCVLAWSNVERSMEFLTVALLSKLNLDTDIAVALVANLELRERCKVASALTFYANLPDRRHKALIAAINSIDNELRLTRNRLIHDSWKVNENVVTRRKSTGTKVTRPQSHKLDLHIPTFEYFDHSDLIGFIDLCDEKFHIVSNETEDALDVVLRRPRITASARFPHLRKFWSRLVTRSD